MTECFTKKSTLLFFVSLLTLGLALQAESVTEVQDALELGDQEWLERGVGSEGRTPRPEPVNVAIAAFQQALAADPESFEAREGLLRALYFKGEFLLADEDERLELFTLGRDIADQGRDLLSRRAGISDEIDDMEPAEIAEALGDLPGAAATYFWSATHWGLWGQYRGKIAAARQGVAGKIRDYAQITIALDEDYENGGGHRVLGRLHSEAPKLPFVTGWVDRNTAVEELERALEAAPDDLLGRLYLAEALLDHHAKKRQQALDLLESIAASEPDTVAVVEDTAAIEDAAARLLEETR